MRIAALAFVALSASCGDAASYIIVELDSARPLQIAAVDIKLNNGSQTSTTRLEHDLTVPPAKTFALKLEPDRRGDVALDLIARDRAGAEVGRWSGAVTIAPGRSVSVRATFGGAMVADMAMPAPDMAAAPDLRMPDLAMPDLWHRRTLGFAPAVFYGQAAGNVAVADFNRDKVPDVVVTAGNAVDVMLGVGDGTLRSPVRYSVGVQLSGVAAGDLNGDGAVDLAFSDANCCQFWSETMLGNGDGTFQTAQQYGRAYSSWGVAMADLDRDGRADVVIGHGSDGIGVALSGVDGKLKAEMIHRVPTWADAPATGDLNGDGNVDIAALDRMSPAILAFAGNGNGMLAPSIATTLPPVLVWLVLADMNGDGRLDAAFVADQSVGIALGTGDGRFGMPWTTFEGAGPLRLVAGDLDDDGREDIAVTDLYAGNVAVFPGKGDGTLSGGARFAAGTKPGSIASADLNRDGLQDLIVSTTNNGQPRVAVLINTSM